MGNEGRPIRFGEALPLREPAIADLLDPIALEERLKEARARRTAALAGRKPAAAPPARPDFVDAASAFLHDRTAEVPADAPAAPPRIETFRTGPAAAEPSPPLPVTPETVPETVPETATAPEPLPVAPEPAPAAEPAAELTGAAAAPATTKTPDRGLVRVPVWAIFATGLLLGAAVVALVVLTPASPPQLTRAVPGPDATPATPTAVAAATATAAPEAPAPAASAAATLPDIVAPAAMTAAAVPVPTADLPPPAAEPAPVPEDVLEVARLAPAPLAEAPAPEPVEPEIAASEPAAPELATAATPPAIAPRPRPVATPVATAAEAPVPGALPTRVTIHYPASAAAEAERARAALAEAGIADVAMLPVRLDISRSNVRFYHATDSTAATTVTGLLSGIGGEAPLARDFTDYRTPAARGTLEVWLAGTRAGGSASAAPPATPAPDTVATTTLGPAPTTTPTTPAPLPLPTAVPGAAPTPTQAEAVARIIVERAYQRLVGAIPGN